MINTNRHPISYRFGVIAEYCLNVGHSSATYTVHLRLIGKLVVDFLFVYLNFFSLNVTTEALRVNIDWK